METKDYVTLFLATIGTVLGITNLVRSLLQDRVKLRVIPKLAFTYGGGVLSTSDGDRLEQHMAEFGMPRLAVEIVNLSKFSVIIDEVGLKNKTMRARRAVLPQPILPPNKTWPATLAARESITTYFAEGEALHLASNARAYAQTSCGVTAFGTSAALRRIAKVIET